MMYLGFIHYYISHEEIFFILPKSFLERSEWYEVWPLNNEIAHTKGNLEEQGKTNAASQ